MFRPYPERNPFPYEGTLSIEGRDGRQDMDEPTAGAPTLAREPVLGLLGFTEAYLSLYGDLTQRRGQVVSLFGDHGSGKTHTIRYVMAEIERIAGAPPAAEQPGPGFGVSQAYVKFEGPDLLAMYRDLMPQFSHELLRQVSRQFQAVMIGRKVGVNLSDPQAGRQVGRSLAEKPDQADGVLQTYFVERGEVEEMLASAVHDLTQKTRDFPRVFSFLHGVDDLSEAAYAWLCGKQVSDEHLRRLGVSGPMATAESAKWGLRLIVTLFGSVGRALVLYLDQFEKFTLVSQNIGILHSLVEVIPREKCMLVLAGNTQAWQALPLDLKQRFGSQVIECPLLTFDEAKDLIRLYLTPPSELFHPNGPEEEMLPFTANALREMLIHGAANVRRLMQTCSVAFEAAFPTRSIIDAPDIQRALSQRQRVLSRDTVARDVERILFSRGLPVYRGYKTDRGEVDFAVAGPQDTPRLFISITDAFFHVQEALNALSWLNVIEYIRRERIPARFVAIVVGYASPEIGDAVREYVDDLIVYDPDTFAARFGVLLNQLSPAANLAAGPQGPPGPQGGAAKEEIDTLKNQLDKLRTSLEDVLRTRESEASVQDKRLNDLLAKQKEDREAERTRAAMDAWPAERDRIKERMARSRADRQRSEFEELERLRDRAEVGHPWWMMWILRSVFVGGIFRKTRLSRELELAEPVNSLQDLQFLAQAAGLDSRERYLKSANPHLRFAAATSSESNGAPLRLLLDAFQSERSAIVRRALARPIADHKESSELTFEIVPRGVPEVVYLVERLAERGPLRRDLFDPLPSRLKTVVAVVWGAEPQSGDPLPLQLAAARRLRSPQGPWPEMVAAFEGKSSRLPWISEDRLRQALRELSPFEEGGLGGYFDLKCLEEVERMYLFFCQISFLIDRGVLRPD